MKKFSEAVLNLSTRVLKQPNSLIAGRKQLTRIIEQVPDLTNLKVPVLQLLRLAGQYPDWADEVLLMLRSKVRPTETPSGRHLVDWEVSYWWFRAFALQKLKVQQKYLDDFILAVNDQNSFTSPQILLLTQLLQPMFKTSQQIQRSLTTLILDNFGVLEPTDFGKVLNSLRNCPNWLAQYSQQLDPLLNAYLLEHKDQLTSLQLQAVKAVLTYKSTANSFLTVHSYRFAERLKTYIEIGKCARLYQYRNHGNTLLNCLLPHVAAEREVAIFRKTGKISKYAGKNRGYQYTVKMDDVRQKLQLFQRQSLVKDNRTASELAQAMSQLVVFGVGQVYVNFLKPLEAAIDDQFSVAQLCTALYCFTTNNVLCDLDDNPNIRKRLFDLLDSEKRLNLLNLSQLQDLCVFLFRTMPHHKQLLMPLLPKLQAYLIYRKIEPSFFMGKGFLPNFCICKETVTQMPQIADIIRRRSARGLKPLSIDREKFELMKLEFYSTGYSEKFAALTSRQKRIQGESRHSAAEETYAKFFTGHKDIVSFRQNVRLYDFEIDFMIWAKADGAEQSAENKALYVDFHGWEHYYFNNRSVLNPNSYSKKALLDELGVNYYILGPKEQADQMVSVRIVDIVTKLKESDKVVKLKRPGSRGILSRITK